jgi:hypothetical protein
MWSIFTPDSYLGKALETPTTGARREQETDPQPFRHCGYFERCWMQFLPVRESLNRAFADIKFPAQSVEVPGSPGALTGK